MRDPSALFVTIWLAGFSTVFMPSQCRVVKRIADGDVISSQRDFSLFYFVHLRKAWGCVSNQQVHELGGCQEKPLCGGTLFTTEFVITAAHCVVFFEFSFVKKSYEIYKQNDLIAREMESTLSFSDLALFRYIETGVKVFNLIVKIEHAFHSSFVLLAGSHDYLSMTQKRHARQYLPHPYFGYGDFALLDHDVALFRTCLPFDITSTVKTVNVMPLNELKLHWESIVKRSAACLYVGFGSTEDATTSFYINDLLDIIPTQYMRYTWRQLKCASRCNFNESKAWDQPRNPCAPCSDHIPPSVGTPLHGDSGSPIICDGQFIGHHIAGHYEPLTNFTQSWLYPLHCVMDALSPEKLSIYKTYTPRGYHPLIIR